MNAPLKHTIIAMATAALGFAAGCSSDEPEATEASSGGEMSTEAPATTEEAPAADPAADPAAAESGGDAEASCAEGSCG